MKGYVFRIVLPCFLWGASLAAGTVLQFFHPAATHPGWFFLPLALSLPINLPVTWLCIDWDNIKEWVREKQLEEARQKRNELIELEREIARLSK